MSTLYTYTEILKRKTICVWQSFMIHNKICIFKLLMNVVLKVSLSLSVLQLYLLHPYGDWSANT